MWSEAFPPSCCSGSLPSTAAFKRNTAICWTPLGSQRSCNHKGDPWGTLSHEFPSGQCGAALKKAAGLLFFLASGWDPCGSSVQVSRTVEWLCWVFFQYTTRMLLRDKCIWTIFEYYRFELLLGYKSSQDLLPSAKEIPIFSTEGWVWQIRIFQRMSTELPTWGTYCHIRLRFICL